MFGNDPSSIDENMGDEQVRSFTGAIQILVHVFDRRHQQFSSEVLGASPSIENLPDDESLRPDEVLSRAELLAEVQRALDRLPANYASALEWKYIEGCSVGEIATRLGLNAIATQSLLARARQALKAALQSATRSTLDELLPPPREAGS